MRLWSIHPKYLDTKGLVALWRESLLAKAVLEGKTKGYTKHPQLERFRNHKKPIKAINAYLNEIYIEAESRGYNFDKSKIEFIEIKELIQVNDEQIKYEFLHLLKKLRTRDPIKHSLLKNESKIKSHPLIKTKKGPIEKWEVIN
jgi:hypothetical protein